MDCISDYYRFIDESNLLIINYKKQISDLTELLKESKREAEQFSSITVQRRRNIENTINGQLLKHPMMYKLRIRLSAAIDTSYENIVMNNFQSIEEEILEAIHKIENKIDEEKNSISSYEGKISVFDRRNDNELNHC